MLIYRSAFVCVCFNKRRSSHFHSCLSRVELDTLDGGRILLIKHPIYDIFCQQQKRMCIFDSNIMRESWIIKMFSNTLAVVKYQIVLTKHSGWCDDYFPLIHIHYYLNLLRACYKRQHEAGWWWGSQIQIYLCWKMKCMLPIKVTLNVPSFYF